MTATDKAAPKLKRCPACGRRDTLCVMPWGADWLSVVCKGGCGCGMRGPSVDGHGGTADADAIARWNALPRRKRVGRKKAEAAVDALIDAAMRSAVADGGPGPRAFAAVSRHVARARLMAMLTGEAEPKGAGEVGP